MAGLGACPLHREGSVLPPAPPAPPAPDRMPAGGGHDCPLPAGENVKAFFSRVAALAFERSVLQDLERRSNSPLQVGGGDVIRKCRAPGLGTWSWAWGRAEGGPGLLSDATLSLTASLAWDTGPDSGGQ